MRDSNEEDDDRGRESDSQMNLAGFMFGNINDNGELEDDVLDSDAKKYLGSLCQLGFKSMLNEIISQDGGEDTNSNNVDKLQDNYKLPSALDFSDITELAEDYHEEQEIKEKELAGYEADDESTGSKSQPKENAALQEDTAKDKKYDTPLASMRPSKYADVEITELFPDFRPQKVLRFSKLFGPGKPSSLPQIWKSVRKKHKRKKHSQADLRDHNLNYDFKYSTFKDHKWELNYGPDPKPEDCCKSDEIKLIEQSQDNSQVGTEVESDRNGENDPKVADWRFGPAQIWYDILKVPESGENFNYGFKVQENKQTEKKNKIEDEEIKSDAFLMVTQLHWEDDVIWNVDDAKDKAKQKSNWIPTADNRTSQAFCQLGKRTQITDSTGPLKSKMPVVKSQPQDNSDDTWYSIFPVENEELVYGLWEDEIIWDAQNMKKIPKPSILTLDPNDENIILRIPDDVDPALLQKRNVPTPKVKIPHPHVKKSKMLLGKAGVINILQEDAPPPPPKAPDSSDPFNISNDVYYQPKFETTIKLKVGGANLIQHSTPVVELRSPLVQTHMNNSRLRNFHRLPLKRIPPPSPLCRVSHHAVNPLNKHIKSRSKQREQERIASGGGDVFFMRTIQDLSGCDGDIILVEFSEEHPPLMNLVGMCSKLKNYYKRTVGKDQCPNKYKYGELVYAHTSPFLGILSPGQSIQTVENNMYRVPIYEHETPPSDFLVIRTRDKYYIREVDALFVAGQQCPLYEVPGPNSKRANNFVRDFLQVFIYRLFWRSTDTPRRIQMDKIKEAFPSHSESSIRKRLKLCADFKRTGMDCNKWVIKPDFRLPTEEEIRAMVSPEQCCAYFSMIAAGQRLKDAGYGEKFLFTPQDDDDEETQLKMDDEVKVAPWNTTRAYIQAMRGKCLLQLTGPADPTGCGEGFSYVRVPNKPTVSKEEQEAQPKRIVTGTDADLRRLPLNTAKALLRKFGVPEEEIKKLSRWEVIDVVRTLSTEKAKAGEEGMTKFSRGNRFSIAEHVERYKEECQRIFDLQNRVLSSQEALSTDEGSSSGQESGSDIEEMGKNIENMLANKKTSSQLTMEQEEKQRRELHKMLMGDDSSEVSDHKKPSAKDKKQEDEDGYSAKLDNSRSGRILKIHRTFKDPDGNEYTRVEVVRKPAVIDTYLKIRNSKDENFIKQFAALDEQQKEEMKREKRRIQEQLRRIKRNQEKERLLAAAANNNNNNSNSSNSNQQAILSKLFKQPVVSLPRIVTSPSPVPTISNAPSPVLAGSSGISKPTKSSADSPSPAPKRKKYKSKPDLKLKCGACGNVGHMRTNKACPLYQGGDEVAGAGGLNPLVSGEEQDEESMEKTIMHTEDDALVNVEGTKVKLSSKLIKHAEESKRRTLTMKLPKEGSGMKKRKRASTDESFDYLKRYHKTPCRQRTDPIVVLSTILENVLNGMRDLPDVQPFLFPVNSKVVPDYYTIITKPMDLQTIRENLRLKKYHSRAEFLADVNQMVENSALYNGPENALTYAAQRMLSCCVQQLANEEERIMRLEKAINPLLDDNDQVAMTFIFDNVVTNYLKSMPEAWPFLKPVNKKLLKDYYTVIHNPMDLETISKKVTAHKYHNRYEFLRDVELILENCTIYNGIESPFTIKARAVFEVCRNALGQYDEYLAQLERNIALVQQRAIDHMDLDSASWLGPEFENYSNVGFESSSKGFPGENTNPYDSSQMDFDFVSVENHNIVPPHITPRNKKKDVLEEDLQFSSEDEFEEVQFKSNSSMMQGIDMTGERENIIPPEDDSKQAAEAMVQLSIPAYFGEQPMIQQEGSNDVDSNYDPSEFLMAAQNKVRIQDDLAVSESDEEENHGLNVKPRVQQPAVAEDDDPGDLWF